jgi:hypothetical protein
MPNRLAIFLVCLVALLVGPAATAHADATTQLPFANTNGAWLAVDPSGQHVFVSGGAGTSSIVVLNYSGQIVNTITGEGGASQMAVDTANHTLYVALHDQTAISEINTQTLIETKRFSTAPYPNPTSLVIAGGKLWFSCYQSDGEGCHGIVSADLDGTNMSAAISGWFFAAVLAAGGPGNDLLAVADTYQEPSDVTVYNVSGSTPSQVSDLAFSQRPAFVDDMAFDPSGQNLLLTAGSPYYVESLSTSDMLPSGQYPIGPYPTAVALTANGQYVAGGRDTNTGDDVFVYRAGTTTPVRTWQVGNDNGAGLLGHGLAFTPDGSRLFAIAEDATTGHLAFHVLSSPTTPLTATTTSLTRVTPVKGTVRYGSQASLKVQVNGAASGTVDLYATPTGGTMQLVGTGTLSSGTKTFSVKPAQNTAYSAQLEQGSTWASSASQEVSVDVAPLVSVSNRARGKGRYKGHRVTRTQLNAKVNPARPGELVAFVVQRRAGKHWRADVGGQVALASNGTAKVLFLTNRQAQFRFQVKYPGDSDFVRGASAWKKFRTRRP